MIARTIHAEELARIVIGVDPAVTSEPGSDSTGIIIAGLGLDNHGYVLKDLTCKGTPDQWARTVITAYHFYQADKVIAEANNGGDLVTSVLLTIDPNLPVRKVHATRGKITRADPISALYEQGLIHHCGEFPELEDELCGWFPGMKSPDRLDALVWALWELFPENMTLGLVDLLKDRGAQIFKAVPQPTLVTPSIAPQPVPVDTKCCPSCGQATLQARIANETRCGHCGKQYGGAAQPKPLGGRTIHL